MVCLADIIIVIIIIIKAKSFVKHVLVYIQVRTIAQKMS
jgi:hypothetical protein